MPTRYLELGDYLIVAEAILGIAAETLARLPRLDLADSALNAPAAGFGGVEAYPEQVEDLFSDEKGRIDLGL